MQDMTPQRCVRHGGLRRCCYKCKASCPGKQPGASKAGNLRPAVQFACCSSSLPTTNKLHVKRRGRCKSVSQRRQATQGVKRRQEASSKLQGSFGVVAACYPLCGRRGVSQSMKTNRFALRAFCCKKALMVALGSLPTQPAGIAGWQAVAGLQAFPPTDPLDNVDSGKRKLR